MSVVLALSLAITAGAAATVVAWRLAARRVAYRFESALAVARHEAEHDGLTGALTRAAFERELTARIAVAGARRPLALLAIDVDGFGTVNKLRGHAVGDALLVQLVRTVAQAIRHEDAVGRLGGDEFAVLVSGEQPQRVAERILVALRAGHDDASGRIDGGEMGVDRAPGPIADETRIDVSIGIATAPGDGMSGALLMRAADVAMRRAKRAGKGRVVAYAGETIADRDERQARAALLRAIEERRIAMAVQPVVDLRSGAIHGNEALARFDLGSLSTGEVFALAERVGLRGELDLACLEHSLALLPNRPRGTRLSVNVAGALLAHPRAIALLEAIPEADARDLVLEITEEALVRDYGALRRAVDPLLERGVRVAVDDMGAGHSGLRHAIDLHPAYLKLDRALISGVDRDPKRAALVDALLRYAEHAGSHIVAEGVETEGELATLRRLGVPYAQGFLLARPAQPWPPLSIALAPLPPTSPGLAVAALASERDVCAIAPDATAEEAQARFGAEPSLDALVVLDDDGRPCGLLTRHRLLSRLGHRFGFALHGQRSVLSVADRRCLTLSETTPWAEIASRAMARPSASRHDPIVLLGPDGRFARHLTIRSLLAAASADERDDAAPHGAALAG